MAISDAFLQELRSRVDIESLISPYVNLRRRGRLYTGLCPFHNEKTPSFTVYPDSQSFYCFGCGAGGEIITFIRRIENLDFVEAVKVLAERAGLPMPEDGYDDSLMKKRRAMLEANREAARFFHETLCGGKGQKALRYLTNRGLSRELITRFGLGFAPDSWDALLGHMKQKGFSAPELYQANLVAASKRTEKVHYYDSFRNRIMFPIIDLRGNVIAFGGRVLDDSKPKYVNTSDTLVYKKSQGVYALNLAKNGNGGKLILAEGYMDVIALHQAGFTNAVACLGTALTKEQAKLLSRYAEEVILAYDSDEAGSEATRKALSVFNTTGLKIRVLRLEGGKDPDEIIRVKGREYFQRLIDGAANDIEYRLLAERKKYDTATADGKLNFLKSAVPVLATLPGPIERDVYAARLAEEFGVAKDAIVIQVDEAVKKREKNRERQKTGRLQKTAMTFGFKTTSSAPANIRAVKAEELLISALLRNPDFYSKLSRAPDPDDFVTDFNKRVYTAISERLKSGKPADLTVLSSEFTVEEMEKIAGLSAAAGALSNTVAECDDCINVLKEEKNKRKTPNPSEISDEDFLKLFNKKNT